MNIPSSENESVNRTDLQKQEIIDDYRLGWPWEAGQRVEFLERRKAIRLAMDINSMKFEQKIILVGRAFASRGHRVQLMSLPPKRPYFLCQLEDQAPTIVRLITKGSLDYAIYAKSRTDLEALAAIHHGAEKILIEFGVLPTEGISSSKSDNLCLVDVFDLFDEVILNGIPDLSEWTCPNCGGERRLNMSVKGTRVAKWQCANHCDTRIFSPTQKYHLRCCLTPLIANSDQWNIFGQIKRPRP